MLSSPPHHRRGWIAAGALACGMHAALACDPDNAQETAKSGVHGRWQDGRRCTEFTPGRPHGEPPVPSYRDVPLDNE